MYASARLLVLLSAAGALSACATQAPLQKTVAASPQASAPSTTAQAGVGPTPDASILGLYLAGTTAISQGRSDIAVDYLAQAANMVDESGQGFLKEQAFNAAIVSGRLDEAAALAPAEGQGSASSFRLGRLVAAVDALAKGDGAAAYENLKVDAPGTPYRNATMMLRPWAAAMAGDAAGALSAPENRADPLTQAYGQQTRAILLERAGKIAEAEAAYKGLVGQDTRIPLFSVNYAYFLERQNRRPEAIALYDALLMDRPDDRIVKAARERAKSRKTPPPTPTLQQGAASTLLALASTAMNANQQATAVAYLQMALKVDPQRNEARLLIADWMETLGNRDGSRVLYTSIPRSAPEYLVSRRALAASYAATDEDQKALQVAQETAREFPDDLDAQLLLADLLRQTRDFPGAVAVLNKVVAARGKDANWQLYFSRAIALEKSGNWPAAEKDLRLALAQAPNESQLLNYLGYSWADRGEHLTEALDMLNKAARAQPNSGAILDSLGWAYFKSGDTTKALTYLERAVEKEPSDPDINNHLGDVYLKVGRTLEARYQWARVLTLEPEPAMKADAEAKLAAHPEEPKAAVAAAEPAHPVP